jgi:hypothetical protein
MKITEVAQTFGLLFFHGKSRHCVGLRFGRFFSQTHLVTLNAATHPGIQHMYTALAREPAKEVRNLASGKFIQISLILQSPLPGIY